MTLILNKEKFLMLIEGYLNDKFDTETFIHDFLELWREDRDNTTNLDYKQNKAVSENTLLSELTNKVFSSCDVCNLDNSSFDDEVEITEKQFKEEVKLALKEYEQKVSH